MIEFNGERIYIIGDNGSGKSRLLESDAQLKSLHRDVLVISSVISDKFTFGVDKKNKGQGSYTYLGNRTVGNASHINILSANAILYAKEIFEKDRSEIFFKAINVFGFDSKIGVKHRKIRRLENNEEFNDAVLSIDVLNTLDNYFSSKSKPFKATFFKNEIEYDFEELSSGEQAILILLLKIFAKIEEKSVIYVDEPEVSLHISWQVRWPEIFHSIIDNFKGVNSIVATHSPIIISSALALGANCYQLNQDGFKNINEVENNVEGVIFDNFDTITVKNKYIYSKFAELINRYVNVHNNASETFNFEEIDEEKDALKNKILRASTTQVAERKIEKIIDDFEKAISEIKNIK